MVDRIEQDAAAGDRELLLLAVHARDPERPAGEELGREVAERRDHLRLDQLDLAEEVRLARLDLVRLRIAVAGRPAFQDIRHEHVVARDPDPGQELVEQLPRLADERDALLVLVEAGSLADEHQVGVRVARAEHDLRPSLREPAARATQRSLLRTPRASLRPPPALHSRKRVYEARPTDTMRARQRPRGASTSISSPGAFPSSARPTGDSGETPPTLVISISNFSPSSRSSSTTRADGDDAARRGLLLVDDRRVLEPVAQHPDPRLEQPLLVLRRVVLEVLGEVAVRPCRRDRLHDLLPLRALELARAPTEAAREQRASAARPLRPPWPRS